MIIFALAMLTLRPNLARAQAVTPQFEVSSVKENVSQSDASKISSSMSDRFVATNVPVYFLLLYAYDLHGFRLIGAPDWTHEKAYDVVGKYPADRRPTDPEIRMMMQQLLAERFGLKLHKEERQLPAYDLVIARKDGRLGSQLHKSEVDCVAWLAQTPQGSSSDAEGPSSVSRPECRIIATRKFLTGGAQSMQDLAGPLEAMLAKPVVDRTGLTGAYDFDLQFAPTELRGEDAAGATPTEGPSLFTALEEQLGLKLVASKEKFDVFVVDQIRPADRN